MDAHFTSAKPAELKCEHRINPLGIDTNNPRLEWVTEYNGYNSYQSALRIIVSDTAEFYNAVWDSGKVLSSETVAVFSASGIYLKDLDADESKAVFNSNRKLKSGSMYFWKVIIWNEKDEPSQWSEPAFFSTGLFQPQEWKAEWISHYFNSYDNTVIHFHEGEDCWIWHPLKNQDERLRSVVLKKTFEVEIEELISAIIIITADEKFALFINDTPAAESDDKIFSWSRPVVLDVKKLLKRGSNCITIKGANSYVDEPGVLFRMELNYPGHKEIISSGDDWESCFEKEQQNSAVKESNDYSPVKASVIRKAGDKPYRLPHAGLQLNPPAYFRKTFQSGKEIRQAFVYCSALGLYHLYINGEKINDGFLQPGWSDFNKSAFYNTYDVTSIIKKQNVMNAILADGYYSGYCGWEKGRGYYGEFPALKIQLMIKYADGSEEIISTDKTWLSSEGPIREADILMGECYESENEYLIKDWDKHEAELPWFKPVVVINKNVRMVSYCADPIKERHELRPAAVNRIAPEKFIVDFGQNFAGFVRLNVKGLQKRITLRFAEVLNNDGTLYLNNIRMARATDTYYSSSSESEIWQPLFTYHGFRYAEISGLEEIDENTVTGISINSLPEQTAFFNSSHSMLNKLNECILWNQRSNYVDIPTDCPQRDERFGWTGDAASYLPTAAINHDVSSFYTKWFQNLFEAQTPEGQLPPFAPAVEMGVGPRFYNSAGWADAGIISLYQFYQIYNDPAILEKYYGSMVKFMNSLARQSSDYILPEHGYGDWLYSGEETSKSLIATAYYAYDARLMQNIAGILGKTEDSVYFQQLADKIKGAYRKAFLNSDGSLKQLTQTAAVLSLHFNLLEEPEQEHAAMFLLNDIIENNFHLKTGFLGLAFIFPVLTSDYFESLLNSDKLRTKYAEAAPGVRSNDGFQRSFSAVSAQLQRSFKDFSNSARGMGKYASWKILTNNNFPSWFFMINNGATTLWERWDAWHPEKGFFDPTMNSFNHCSLGCVGEWLYSGLAGISIIEPGFKTFKIKPYIPDDLQFVQAAIKTKNGKVKSGWSRTDKNVTMQITVPFNTSAEIYIESEKFSINNDYVLLHKEENYSVIKTSSGNYTITFTKN